MRETGSVTGQPSGGFRRAAAAGAAAVPEAAIRHALALFPGGQSCAISPKPRALLCLVTQPVTGENEGIVVRAAIALLAPPSTAATDTTAVAATTGATVLGLQRLGQTTTEKACGKKKRKKISVTP